MSTNKYPYDGIAVAVDDKEQTIWYAFNHEEHVIYFQCNLSDLSLIGNKYAAFNTDNFLIQDIDTSEGIVVFSVYKNRTDFIIIVNATTQEVINQYQNVRDSYTRFFQKLLVIDGYINILSSSLFTYFNYYAIHDQIPLTLEYDNMHIFDHDSFERASILTFNSTNNSSYDLNYHIRVQHRTKVYIAVVNSGISHTNEGSFAVLQNHSHIMLLYTNLNEEIVDRDANHTIYLTINSQGTLNTYNVTYHDVLDPNDTSLKIVNFTFPTLQVQVPNVHTPEYSSIKIFVNYSNNVSPLPYVSSLLTASFVLNVVGDEGNRDNGKKGYVTKGKDGIVEHELNDDGICVFSDSERFEIIIPHFEMISVKLGVGIITGIGLTIKIIRSSPHRDDWAIIHIAQQMLFLPLMANFTTSQIQDVIVSNGISALSVYMLPSNMTKLIPYIKDLTFDQNDPYLK